MANSFAVLLSPNRSNEVAVPSDLRAVVAVAAGDSHTCAVQADGRLVCGRNYSGQCTVPADLGAVAAVAAGNSHTSVLLADGSLACFGANSSGQCDIPV